MNDLTRLQQEISNCGRCARLRDHCARVAVEKRRAYRTETYWGRPVPSFGDPAASLLIVGLAPGAHGANRTGRMFTGDSSGDFLYRVLHATGFASQPESRRADDGLHLIDAWITASAHCAPPDNKPLGTEIAACRAFLHRELDLLSDVRAVVALGRIAFDNYLQVLVERGAVPRKTAFTFAHGAVHRPGANLPALIASYHPSQQNTSTGRLTEPMLRAVFETARKIVNENSAGSTAS